MIRNLLLLAIISLLSFTSLHAQDSDHPTEEDYEHNYEHEYHYEFGPWGYRAEAQLMDSLAILEMMGEVTPAEARQEKEKFRKAKQDKQRDKKEKMRKKRKNKKKKDKEKKAKKN